MRKRHAHAKDIVLIGKRGVDLRLRWRREGALAAGRLDEEERDVLGTDVPRGKGDGDAHSEIRDICARTRRHLQELLPQAARSGSLDKDALRQRAGGCGGGGGHGWRDQQLLESPSKKLVP